MSLELEKLKQKHAELGELISKFEMKQRNTIITLPHTKFALHAGQRYAGMLLGECERIQHIILLPGETESVTWAQAKEWAAKVGGELPTRREQSLLFANLKDEFQKDWYWSAAQHATIESDAWCQYFSDGFQYYNGDNSKLRARAVRRLAYRSCRYD